jgi:hypothetical protein
MTMFVCSAFLKWIEQNSDVKTLSNSVLPIRQITIEEKDRQRLRIQDGELMQMIDDGMCISMHQPWASLLVRGIKMYLYIRLNF